jgi:hypothetical protein
MSDEPKKRSGAWIGWALLAFLVLYPASVGPMAWLEKHDWIPSIVMDVYRPFWYVPLDRHPWDWLSRWETFCRDM